LVKEGEIMIIEKLVREFKNDIEYDDTLHGALTRFMI